MESRCQLLWQLLAAVCSPTEETSYSLSSIIEQAGSGMEGSAEKREERQSHAWHAASGLFQKSVYGTFRAYTLTYIWKHMHSHNKKFSLTHTHMHTHMHFGSCSSYLPFISSIFLCSMGSVVVGLLEVGLLQRQEVRDRLRGPELAFSLYSTTLHVSVALMGLYRWMFYINMKKCKSSTRKKAKHTDLFSLTSEDH